jgi:hypothetical protein
MSLLGKYRENISNPLLWVLIAALVLTGYDNYRKSQDISRVCALTGPHEIAVPIARSPREEVDNICVSRQTRLPSR